MVRGCGRHFRPSSVNLWTRRIIFDRCAERQGWDRHDQIAALEQRLWGENIHLDLDRWALAGVGDEAYDPVFVRGR